MTTSPSDLADLDPATLAELDHVLPADLRDPPAKPGRDRPWSDHDDEHLLSLMSTGHSIGTIAKLLDRTAAACSRRAWRLLRNSTLRKADYENHYLIAFIRLGERVH
jgi:hypothetical protein